MTRWHTHQHREQEKQQVTMNMAHSRHERESCHSKFCSQAALSLSPVPTLLSLVLYRPYPGRSPILLRGDNAPTRQATSVAGTAAPAAVRLGCNETHALVSRVVSDMLRHLRGWYLTHLQAARLSRSKLRQKSDEWSIVGFPWTCPTSEHADLPSQTQAWK